MISPPPFPFSSAKRTILHKLATEIDFSPKGSIDAPVRALVDTINSLPNLVTTSSCSGRIALYAHSACGEGSEKGAGAWLYVEHGCVDVLALAKAATSAAIGSTMTLLVEPCILHVQVSDHSTAVRLLGIALRAGFRESGIVEGESGRGKLIVAVRSNAGALEHFLAWRGEVIVPIIDVTTGEPTTVFASLVAAANERMRAVDIGRERLEKEFRTSFSAEIQSVLANAAAAGAGSGGGSGGAVKCDQCGAGFASKNLMFKTHLLRAKAGERALCPTPKNTLSPPPPSASQTPTTTTKCNGCGIQLPSRSQLFRHINDCTRARALKAPPDAIADTARHVATSLITRRSSEASAFTQSSPTCNAPAQRPLLCAAVGGGDDHARLFSRWSHVAVFLEFPFGKGAKLNHVSLGALLVAFGVGKGGVSGEVHGRRADAVLLDVKSRRITTCTSDSSSSGADGTDVLRRPTARVRSAACAVRLTGDRDVALIFGGHAGPTAPLDDAWIVLVTQNGLPKWSLPTSARGVDSEKWPAARWGHSLVTAPIGGSRAIIFGGRDDSTVFGDLWALDTVEGKGEGEFSVTASPITSTGTPPRARHAHAAVANADIMIIHGGVPGDRVNGDGLGVALADIFVFTLATQNWSAPRISFNIPGSLLLSGRCGSCRACHTPNFLVVEPPLARFSHSLTQLPLQKSNDDDDGGSGGGARRG